MTPDDMVEFLTAMQGVVTPGQPTPDTLTLIP